MRIKRAVFVIPAILISAAATSDQTEKIWTCTEVIDGDTIRVESADGTSRVVHLFGIDAPELRQARGIEAKDFIENLVLRNSVALTIKEQGANGASAVVSIGNLDIARELAGAGLAWLTREGATSDDYVIAIFSARQNKTSVWSDEEREHPSDWRRNNVQPLPSPTPTPTISDFAASTTIEREDGENIVISDIPSVFARNRETMTFFETMIGVYEAAVQITAMETVYSRYCEGNADYSGVVGEGTVWSEDMKDWVQGEETRLGEACRAMARDIDRGRDLVEITQQEAIDTARRFGVKEDVIREVLEYLGLDRF